MLWLGVRYAPAIAKYNGNLDHEVRRVVAKLALRHQHPGLPCHQAECPNNWQRRR
jgi:hypothetical protein